MYVEKVQYIWAYYLFYQMLSHFASNEMAVRTIDYKLIYGEILYMKNWYKNYLCFLIFYLFNPTKYISSKKNYNFYFRGAMRYLRCLLFVYTRQKFNITVPVAFQKTVRSHPDRVALYFEDQSWTFQKVRFLSLTFIYLNQL